MEQGFYQIPIQPLLNSINQYIDSQCNLLIAIDGNCAAGKTSLGIKLKEVYNCNVIPMDHFFLRQEQRTKKRLGTPGGNVDYERFKNEVLIPLKRKESFRYRPYLCSNGSFGEEIYIEHKLINVIEGTYSLHPELSDAYELKIFMSVSASKQLQRIRIRDGEEKAKRFQNEWIPMENRYFETFKIKSECSFSFDTT